MKIKMTTFETLVLDQNAFSIY